ncbi:hypothetical protein Pta02_72600 [Planobispora takensis]|uniref:Uncharacterized protein n=1 Tax=Planobispora takensis TaxID=1367882 RepID=A0A8J3T380_9ACTN|nr:hypothetical protein Pta02_72600 [Planobispora takensis]
MAGLPPRHNGTAPIPVCGGNGDRHRLNRGGDRQLDAALHRIAITQARCHAGAGALRSEIISSTGSPGARHPIFHAWAAGRGGFVLRAPRTMVSSGSSPIRAAMSSASMISLFTAR